MNLLVTIRIALRALAKNKMRAALTVLGIVIGIAAVTTMVSIGQSAGQLFQGLVQSLGTNVMWVTQGSRSVDGVRTQGVPTLTAEDAQAISEECPAVLATSPLVWTGGQVIVGNVNWNPNEMLGVGSQYLTVRNWELSRGDFFSEQEIRSAAKSCVIGHTLVAKLFQTANPIGEEIRVKNIPFRVVGVLAAKGSNMVGQDQDNVLLMPHTTVRRRLQGSSFNTVGAVMVSARRPDLMDQAAFEIGQLLYERHRIPPGDPADFEIHSSQEASDFLNTLTGSMTLLLAAIAAISLLVGGIGIMNIMLVSVTERTREIGIRMAVGARGRDILRQFLVESVILSLLGGIVGVALGIGASVGVTKLINAILSGEDWPVVISLTAAGVALLFAAAVGVFFGYYPARRASRLDPIEALRYE
ncbi:Macrolide export ATP-binding/permease protein MacB [Posidoniimonas corsicana]|uniref:Macrolide export ATP-binding/permease protein MacB n=1 Tax=Posidoniimonas corsicana TaxID=1938618 RepID=A0A5C5VER8_9BACT|nr:ABC transporter permease [Posidoniimonas corsicana]TWT37136.1 Macrolide export ATP-binding/permease protein MacB [Posidoniimonas corsicana]